MICARAKDEIWIVEGRCGQYSDRSEWPVAWCATETEANALRDLCAAEAASLTEEEAYEWAFDDEVRARREGKLKHDPRYQTDYTGTTYVVYSLQRWMRKDTE